MVEFSTMPSCQSGATGKGQRSGSAVGKIRKRATVMSQKLDFRRRSASTASDTLAQRGTPFTPWPGSPVTPVLRRYAHFFADQRDVAAAAIDGRF
jgi:hypothetical protein